MSDDGENLYELYRRGVICPGSGAFLFFPDPEFPERGVCLRCSCSIAVVGDGVRLDDHMVLPELVTPLPWEAAGDEEAKPDRERT